MRTERMMDEYLNVFLTDFLPDRERKLYLAVLDTKGEFPDIITVESESEWYPEMSLLVFSSSSSVTSFISSSTWSELALVLCPEIVMGHAWTSWVRIVNSLLLLTLIVLGLWPSHFTAAVLMTQMTGAVEFNFKDQGSLFVNNVPDTISNSTVECYPCWLS